MIRNTNVDRLSATERRLEITSTINSFRKHILDDGGMATEDALAADMNGDGLPDVVAYGRATHNIRYYENLGGR